MIKSVCGLWDSPLFSELFQMKVFLKNRILPHWRLERWISSHTAIEGGALHYFSYRNGRWSVTLLLIPQWKVQCYIISHTAIEGWALHYFSYRNWRLGVTLVLIPKLKVEPGQHKKGLSRCIFSVCLSLTTLWKFHHSESDFALRRYNEDAVSDWRCGLWLKILSSDLGFPPWIDVSLSD